MRGLTLFDKGIEKIEVVIVSLSIMAMAANSIANVIGRQFFGRSVFFADEFNQFLIVMVTFVGVSYAARKGRHIRMSAFYDQLTDRFRRYVMVLIAGVTSAVMFMLSYYAVIYLHSMVGFGRVTPALQIPAYYLYLITPVGLALAGIQYALTAVRNLVGEQVYVSFTREDVYEDSPSQGAT